jgi:hypothetical protein
MLCLFLRESIVSEENPASLIKLEEGFFQRPVKLKVQVRLSL